MSVLVSLGLAACQAELAPEPLLSRIDSAGVEIVQTSRPLWDSKTAWTVATVPETRIGLIEGDEPYLLSDINGAVLLEDGTIVVADGQSRELRFFDREGRFLRAVGGAGGGPGEFRDLMSLYKCGGGLYTHDLWQRRLNVWDLAGEFQRTLRLLEPGADRGPYRYRCGPDGSFIVAGWGPRKTISPGTTFEYYPQPAPLWLLDSEAQVVLELGEYVSSERVMVINAGGGGGSGPHPFSRSVVFALGLDQVFIGTSEHLEVEVRDRSGRIVRIMRGPDEDLAIGEAFLDEYRSASFSRSDSSQRARLENGGMPMPPRLPAFTDLVRDTEGNLWVKRFQPSWEEGHRWGVFSPSGEFYGHVEMPPGLVVFDITADYVLGVSKDDLDVERVDLFAIHRAGFE